MSVLVWDWSPASAEGLLTNEECSMLLDIDILNADDDLFKTFPNAGAKAECAPAYHVQDDGSSLYPPSPPEAKPARADDLLRQFDNTCKQESFFGWLEEKVDLPIFESIPQEALTTAPPPAAPIAVAAPPTDVLLREFETVYGQLADVELTHLTPPQSPPGPASQLLAHYAAVQWQPAPAAPAAPAPAAPAPDADWGLHDVDELVRRRAAQLASPVSPRSPPRSPRSSPGSSPRSSTDDDWQLPGRARRADDRRSRKKEQNKNAATRYRQKKKAEVEVLLAEEGALRSRHADLGTKCADLQREIRYLKGLMRDLFKAKGLIK